ncbi:electron transport complex subunit RsxC [Candidatus Latescibacterota bacterium]
MAGTFFGGVHPDDSKSISNTCEITKMPVPSVVVLPISQHIGAPAKIIVEKDQTVSKGEIVAEAGGFVSAPVHATVSGTVTAIEPRITSFGRKIPCVVIESDGEDRWADGINAKQDISSINTKDKLDLIRNAGIVGMGGAAFPSHVKLSPPDDKPIDTVILNGVECEPYSTCDDRLMIERPGDIVEGLKIIMEILNCKRGYIGIENNKPLAIKAMQNAVKDVDGITVEKLIVKYPQGGEKQLIYAITKRKVPAGGLPMDVGCVVQNVGTSGAIFEAVSLKKPLVERIVTVTGKGVTKPVNVLARLGDSVSSLIEFAGGYFENAGKLIMGGPMMGIAQFSDEVPVMKGSSCILVMNEDEADTGKQLPCISCARCVDVCPMRLMPSTLGTLVEYEHWDELGDYGIFDCIECGSCSYICPVKRKLVEYIKFGKATLTAISAKEKAEESVSGEKPK